MIEGAEVTDDRPGTARSVAAFLDGRGLYDGIVALLAERDALRAENARLRAILHAEQA